jgi:branched-chain amino acid transport system substrate-binding protein
LFSEFEKPAFTYAKDLSVAHFSSLITIRHFAAVCLSLCGLLQPHLLYAQDKPLRIGVPTAVQLQVGRDTLTAVKMAVDDINKKGGVLGRKFELVSADETENPETGISAIKKLTADETRDLSAFLRALSDKKRAVVAAK